MSEHQLRRVDDDPIYNVLKNWQFYGSVALALISIGGFIATFKVMSSAVEKGDEFQTAQISINARLTTLIETHEQRLQGLEDWRNNMDHWNRH